MNLLSCHFCFIKIYHFYPFADQIRAKFQLIIIFNLIIILLILRELTLLENVFRCTIFIPIYQFFIRISKSIK